MKKIILILLSISTLLIAGKKVDGYEVYKNKCASCHIENISVAKVKKNFSKMKAPPMVEVANQLKTNIIIKDDDEDVHRQVVILFIKNYIDNPDLQYSMCHPMAIEKFGIMPTQKGKIDEAQKQAIAEWIYDRYEGVKFK